MRKVYDLFKTLKKFRFKIVIIAILFLLSALITVIIPLLTKSLMDYGFVEKSIDTIIFLSLSIFFLVLAHQIIEVIKEKFRTGIKQTLVFDLYESSVNALLKICISSIEPNTLRLYNNLDSDIKTISSVADGSVFFVITQVFSMIGGTIGLFIINYKLAILSLLLIPVKFFAVKVFADKREQITKQAISSKSIFSDWFGGFIAGIRDIRLFGLQNSVLVNYRKNAVPYIQNEKKIEMVMAWNAVIDQVIIEAFNTIIYIVGAFLFIKDQITIGGIFSFITYLIYISSPISAILNLRFMLAGIMPSWERFTSFLNLPKESDGNTQNIHVRSTHSNPLIEFKSVSFSYYTDSQISTLDNLSLTIYEGLHTGIWGSNGSGKSTLLNLLLRFYEPSKGEILYNGTPISSYSIESYRKLFAVVSQNLYLFNASIMYNISLEYVSSGDFDKLGIDLTKLNKDINEETNGMDLSGGQKQKIALARALYAKRPILIFDEPTSNLDDFSKGEFKQLLLNQLKNSTVIIISHDDSMFESCSQIIKLEQGRIIGNKT